MRQGHIIARGKNNIGMEQCHYNEAGTVNMLCLELTHTNVDLLYLESKKIQNVIVMFV